MVCFFSFCPHSHVPPPLVHAFAASHMIASLRTKRQRGFGKRNRATSVRVVLLGNKTAYSHHGGQLVYEVIDCIDHKLDVVLLGHAVLAMAAEDDVHVGAEHALCHLHGDVPGNVFILQAVDEAHRAGDGDGTLQDAVVLRLLQEVHAHRVDALIIAFRWNRPYALVLKLLSCLVCGETGVKI